MTAMNQIVPLVFWCVVAFICFSALIAVVSEIIIQAWKDREENPR